LAHIGCEDAKANAPSWVHFLFGEFFGTHIMWICTGTFVEVDDSD
jgi:hypothetical protein